jgi:LacI family transcriptional regulator
MATKSPAISKSRQPRRLRPAPAITIKEVAREAGVSVATISRVVNEKGPVSEETRQRIRGVVERLRYAPHAAARSLITRQTRTLGVLLPDLFGEFFSELIRGIDVAARKRGYHLLVSGSHGDHAETRAMLRAIRGRVDGLIALSPDLDAGAFEENLPAGFPVVLLNGNVRRTGYASILVDNYGGAFAMARHLMRFGHRRIAFVTGPADNHDAAERLRGYRDALGRQIGASGLEISGDFREEAGYRAAPRILRGRRRPTAVFAANDAMAIGLLCAFRERQILVPEDIALAGFDDIPIARFITPPLTTVRFPIAELGRLATARLLHALNGSDEHRRNEEILPTTLVVRSSCGAPSGTKDYSRETSETGLSIARKENVR